MSNVGMKEVYCTKCGILYMCKNVSRLRDIVTEHKKEFNHDSIVRNVYPH